MFLDALLTKEFLCYKITTCHQSNHKKEGGDELCMWVMDHSIISGCFQKTSLYGAGVNRLYTYHSAGEQPSICSQVAITSRQG